MVGVQDAVISHLRREFIPFMGNVAHCERELSELDFNWRMIETIAKMICPSEAKNILPTMAGTRAGFGKLEGQLIDNLILETVRKVVLELRSKAQVVVDIVIRNLYERTADVGFLATDDDIRRFVLGSHDALHPSAMLERLREYRDKYTVYDEIIVLDTAGRVLCHLDQDSLINHSCDPLLAETLASDTYLETFRATDLRPRQDSALVYSRRIEHPETGEPIGVLCLCFRFEDELAGVFARLAAAQERSVMLLLDATGRAIASSDPSHIPVGARMHMVESQYEIVAYAGRDYLATTCSTAGYQGYHGMGWHGHVMVPLSSAFRTYDDGQQHTPEEQARMAAVQANAVNFCPALAEIANDAENINRSLRRVVWNGQVMAASSARAKEEAGGKRGDLSSLKIILQQISETGDRTSRVFGNSIRDLYGTVISSLLADARFIAGLMIDIMDRNLYERANDCRWWALASDIRRIMASGTQDASARERIAAILAYINSLYTVYTRLFVYDVHGVIVAASNLHQDGLRFAGQKIGAEYVARTLALSTSQDYVVSAFEASPLYGNQPTYIYNAAIHDPHDPGRVVGGIGIVFDSTPEFQNMLTGALPSQEGAFALFVDRAGNIIASTTSDLPVGSQLPFPCDLGALANGEGLSTVVTLPDGDYILGAAMSSGYREFKRSGDYHNDVAALVLVPLGADEGSDKGCNKSQAEAPNFPFPTGREVQEFATFYVGEQVYALPAAAVLDSVDVDQLNRVSGARRYLAGLLPMCVGPDETRNIVPIIDTHFLLGVETSQSRRQIIVVQAPEGPLGLLVDELYMVPEVDQALVEALPEMIKQDAGYISGVVRLREDPLEVVQILDPEKIFVAARSKSLPDKILAADPVRQNGKSLGQ